MLEFYSTVHKHPNHKLTSSTSTFETTHQQQLPLNTYVIHKIFKPVHFSTKLKPLRIGPYKIIRHLSVVTYELLPQTGETFQTHSNHIFPNYPKKPIIVPHILNYQLLSPSLSNKPDSMSCKNHLSDTDITSPFSPQCDFNNNSPPNYEDPSPLS